MRPRLAIVLSHPTQYYSPWFRWIAANYPVDLRVFYLWDAGVTPRKDHLFDKVFAWDIDLLSGYQHEFVPNHARDPNTDEFTGLVNPGLFLRLEEWGPDAILLIGYAYITHLALIAWSRLHGIPLIFRGDSHLLGRRRLSLFTRTALRAIYGCFKGVTFVGKANRDYFRTLGVAGRRLFFAPHAVDASHFAPSTPEYQAEAKALRTALGIQSGQKVLLFAGKLYGHKNPRGLLEAFIALNRQDWMLVFVGEGSDRNLLIERAAQVPQLGVRFLPFANQSEMPARYLLADLFCLPSVSLYETWGLAVNEAMHMGRPCLVSDRVGCSRDLILPGKTGWTFKATEGDDLRIKLAEAMDSDLVEMGRKAAEHITKYGYEQAAAGLMLALAQSAGTRLPGEAT